MTCIQVLEAAKRIFKVIDGGAQLPVDGLSVTDITPPQQCQPSGHIKLTAGILADNNQKC